MQMSKIEKFIQDIFFPNRCPFCDKFVRWDKLSCEECLIKLPFVDERVCPLCGKEQCICSKGLYYDKCYTVCFYEGIARDGIIALKTKNAINAAEIFADFLSGKIACDEETYDMIIPVPMSNGKKAERGYNQAEEIAKFISQRTKIPLNSNILSKKGGNIEQHALNAEERALNAKNEFFIKENVNLNDKKIILCDDVITTGNTLNECAKLLKSLGALKIICAVAATTSLKNE